MSFHFFIFNIEVYISPSMPGISSSPQLPPPPPPPPHFRFTPSAFLHRTYFISYFFPSPLAYPPHITYFIFFLSPPPQYYIFLCICFVAGGVYFDGDPTDYIVAFSSIQTTHHYAKYCFVEIC